MLDLGFDEDDITDMSSEPSKEQQHTKGDDGSSILCSSSNEQSKSTESDKKPAASTTEHVFTPSTAQPNNMIMSPEKTLELVVDFDSFLNECVKLCKRGNMQQLQKTAKAKRQKLKTFIPVQSQQTVIVAEKENTAMSPLTPNNATDGNKNTDKGKEETKTKLFPLSTQDITTPASTTKTSTQKLPKSQQQEPKASENKDKDDKNKTNDDEESPNKKDAKATSDDKSRTPHDKTKDKDNTDENKKEQTPTKDQKTKDKEQTDKPKRKPPPTNEQKTKSQDKKGSQMTEAKTSEEMDDTDMDNVFTPTETNENKTEKQKTTRTNKQQKQLPKTLRHSPRNASLRNRRK